VAGLSLLLAGPAVADVRYGTAYEWQVVGTSYAGRAHGVWKFCSEARGPGTVTCSEGFTAGNSVSGTVNASDGDISASVGFSVTSSRTITGGASYAVRRRVEGQVYWRAVFNVTSVKQEEYVCTTVNGSCPFGFRADGRYAYADAYRYIGPGFEYIS
jgi:hypothetical protein